GPSRRETERFFRDCGPSKRPRRASMIPAVRAMAAAVAATLLGASLAGTERTESPHVRLHGVVEPVRSQMVTVPRLTGSGTRPMIIVARAKAGSIVKAGDRVVEFDRAAQIKAAHDREAEYRDLIEQINRKRADQLQVRAKDETDLVTAQHGQRRAELDMLD